MNGRKRPLKQVLNKEKLRELYWEKCISREDIARVYKCSVAHIKRLMDAQEVPVRTRSQARREALKAGKLPGRGYYEINEGFFKRWSPEMAYVLGIYATDGCLHRNPGGGNNIALHQKDRTFLEKVRALLGSTHPVRKQVNNKTSYIYVLGFSNEVIFQDLCGFGITPQKSTTLKFPKVPEQYLRHFVRGVFDGDGSIGIYKEKKEIRVTFTGGSFEFLSILNSKLSERAGVSLRRIYHYGKHYRLIYLGQDCPKLFDYLYKGVSSSFYFERKYNRFLECIREHQGRVVSEDD